MNRYMAVIFIDMILFLNFLSYWVIVVGCLFYITWIVTSVESHWFNFHWSCLVYTQHNKHEKPPPYFPPLWYWDLHSEYDYSISFESWSNIDISISYGFLQFFIYFSGLYPILKIVDISYSIVFRFNLQEHPSEIF